MKKAYTLLTAFLLAITMQAQMLNVKVGCVTYQFPAALTGEMDYSGGFSLNIIDRFFTIADINEMAVASNDTRTDNTVNVLYNDAAPVVTIADEQRADAGRVDELKSNQSLYESSISGIHLNFQIEGITHVEVESVDAHPICSGSYHFFMVLTNFICLVILLDA